MPFVSEAQRRLMYAASKTKGGVAGVSQKAAKKLVAKDEPSKLPEKVQKTDGMISPDSSANTRPTPSAGMASGSAGSQETSVATAMTKAEDNTLSLLEAKKSIHGSKNTPDRTIEIVDTISKAYNMNNYARGDGLSPEEEKKVQGALDFRNQMKQFRRDHGSTIMDIAGGRKIDKQRADAYHAARGNLMIGQGVSFADIPPKIPSHLIDRSPKQPEIPVLPAAKSMEALTNPKSLLAKVDDCTKCMRKSSEEELEKSSKPFHGYNKKKHARSGGLNDSYRKKVNRETGSNLKRPVTKKNVKPGSKAAKRRKSFCARMSGVKGPTSKKGKLTPKGAALKRWRCSKSLNKSESVPLEVRADKVLKSLKSKLLAGAAAIGGLASGAAMASPESDLHSQLSNLNVMGEYHTPKSGSQAVLKEPNQLKADPTHPAASYSRESGSGSSMGSFHGPDAEKAKQLLQNYDAVNKCFTKSTGYARKITPQEKKERDLKQKIKTSEYKPAEKIADNLSAEIWKKQLTGYLSQYHESDKTSNKKLKKAGLADELKKAREVLSKLDKSNSIKPFGQNIYDANANLGRKMGRTGEVVEGAGKNVAVQQTRISAKKQAEIEAEKDKKKNREQPAVLFSLEDIPPEHRKAVFDAYENKEYHPLMHLAVKIKPNSRKKAVVPEELLPPKEKKSGKKTDKPPVILTEEDLKSSYGAKNDLSKAHEVLSKLEKRCWKGYKPVPGKEPYSKGSCAPIKKAISAQDIESGEYEGEKLDGHHHNRIGNEYRELARRAFKQNDVKSAKTYNSKAEYHFDLADKKGYKPPND